MKNLFYKTGLIIGVISLSLSSCKDSLNLEPMNDVTSEIVYRTPLGYQQSLAKVYGSFALTGNAGPTGQPDVVGLDEGGNADYLRTFWKAQELTTDEAVIAWGDAGLQDFHQMNWTPDNSFLRGLYFRSLYQITLVNEFLRESTDAKLASRGISGADADRIKAYRPEVRFLRAYQYWSLMDVFGNPPFVTENDPIGGPLPKQIGRAALFTYIETELKAIEPELIATRAANYYGRATRGAAQALLARLYLNAQVYTGTQKNNEAVEYSKRVIDAGYTLDPNYRKLTLNDNNTSPELIFTINYDGQRSQVFGGTTFLTHAAIGGSMQASDYGVDFGWGGIRTTKALVNLFPNPTSSPDRRANFYTNGQNLEIASLTTFTDGYALPKFQNKTSAGVAGTNLTFVDADFPLFRLAEMYLIYAEATLRGGNGVAGTALTYINNLRTRAYGNATGAVTALSLDLILDERARELHWEGHRRTDLIRYNRFTEATYLWPWKGGIRDGRSVENFRKVFPIPAADVTANPNLVQNPGY
ncbi:RagB/SusD family nutrient uptake outer membrane protein [Pedobacter aquae]|uniref:RagB/SusD family nutrient uptake outer membrane protein n=2 Tax=Pedobacter aquae TaxID=2605747 RepID=A0A5C0VJG4_9SPHI|nr:RagB/SusD family nutrient uptake outer membrane protein [Pedobacter aquae]